jgi:hypothetical protein
MLLKQASYRFNTEMDAWLTQKAEGRGISKNDVLRALITSEMHRERTHLKADKKGGRQA